MCYVYNWRKNNPIKLKKKIRGTTLVQFSTFRTAQLVSPLGVRILTMAAKQMSRQGLLRLWLTQDLHTMAKGCTKREKYSSQHS